MDDDLIISLIYLPFPIGKFISFPLPPMYFAMRFAHLLPVGELVVGRGQLPLEPFGVGAGGCRGDLDVPAREGAA